MARRPTTPIWYVGNLARTLTGNFTGGLYQTTGTGIGAPWNATQHSTTQVGIATFAPTSTTTGTLTTTSTRRPSRRPASGRPFNNTTQTFDVDPVVTQTAGGQVQIVMK